MGQIEEIKDDVLARVDLGKLDEYEYLEDQDRHVVDILEVGGEVRLQPMANGFHQVKRIGQFRRLVKTLSFDLL